MNQSNDNEGYPWGLIVAVGILICVWSVDKWNSYDNAVYAARYKNMRDYYGNIPRI